MKRKTRILLSLVVPMLCYIYFSVSGALYTYSDNLMIAVVTHGMFGKNVFCQYLHPALCLLIKALALVIPSADFFMLLIHVAIFAEIYCWMYLFTAPLEGIPFRKWGLQQYFQLAFSLLTVAYFSMGVNLWGANYTVSAASFVATGSFLLVYSKDKALKPRWIVASTAFFTMGFMLRKEAGLLYLPFVILDLGVGWIENKDKKRENRSLAKYVLPVIALITVIMASQIAFNALQPYAEAKKYNDNRTIVVDYPMKPWNDTDYPDETAYEIAKAWTFIDTDYINAESLAEIAKAGEKNRYDLNRKWHRRVVLLDMVDTAFRTDVYMATAVALVVLMTVWNVITGKGFWRKLEALLNVVGAFIILFYFTVRGRALLRVWQPVIFAVLVITTINFIRSWRSSMPNMLFTLLIGVLLYFSAGQVIAHSAIHAPITAFTSRVNADESTYEKTFDGLYIWPNWYTAIPKYFAAQNKLPTQRVLEHNIAQGDWTYGQPYYTEYLEEIGTPNPAKALVEGKAYLMGGRQEIVEQFLQAHYGKDIHLVETEIIIDERTAYRVERSNASSE